MGDVTAISLQLVVMSRTHELAAAVRHFAAAIVYVRPHGFFRIVLLLSVVFRETGRNSKSICLLFLHLSRGFIKLEHGQMFLVSSSPPPLLVWCGLGGRSKKPELVACHRLRACVRVRFSRG